MKNHTYQTVSKWTGNNGTGTNDYRAYERSHTVTIGGKPEILCSSDPAFRGDPSRHNPEELLVASLSSCHLLWYLHLCAVNGVVVVDYQDEAVGIMNENKDGSGEFTQVLLRPRVTVTQPSMIAKANALHHEAHQFCFIARSVNFPVLHEPTAHVLEK